jgi:hypothetical protein
MYVECPLVQTPYPPEYVQRSRELLDAVVGPLRGMSALRPMVRDATVRFPGYAAEIDHLGGLFGVDPIDLWLANLSYDMAIGLFGCSTMALATPDGPVLARNMDWVYEGRIARASCILPLPGGLSAAFVGAVGVVSGLSRRGFAVVLNAVPGGMDPRGFPVLLFLRHLLDEAGDFDDALARARTTPLASSALITLVGTRNDQRVCVERQPTAARERRPAGDEPLLATNHFRSLAYSDDWVCPRYQYLAEHAPRLPHPPRAEDLLGLLRDENVLQEITAQHVLAHPAGGVLRLFVPGELLNRPDAEGHGLAGMGRFF